MDDRRSEPFSLSTPLNESVRETLKELPSSSKLVFLALAHEGDCTQQELANYTYLSARTVRYGATQLIEANLAQKQPSLDDAQKSIYTLTEEVLPDD